MRTKTPALAIDETTTLEINGSPQCVRLCATRPGLPPLLIVQHGPGVPLLHEVKKFRRRLELERDYLVVSWEQRGCGNAPAAAADGSRWHRRSRICGRFCVGWGSHGAKRAAVRRFPRRDDRVACGGAGRRTGESRDRQLS